MKIKKTEEPVDPITVNLSVGAQQHLSRSLAMRERDVGPSSRDIVPTLTLVGRLKCMAADPAGARAALERAVQIAERAYGPLFSGIFSVACFQKILAVCSKTA